MLLNLHKYLCDWFLHVFIKKTHHFTNKDITIFTIQSFDFLSIHIFHYNDVIIGAVAFQITSLPIVYSTVYSGADQRKHQSSASLAFVRGIHRWPVNSPHKGPVTRKMFPFDDVIVPVCICLLDNMRHWVFPTEWAYNFGVICCDAIYIIQGCFTAVEATLDNTGKLAYYYTAPFY